MEKANKATQRPPKPPKPPKRIWINHTGWANTGECRISVEDHDPSGEPAPTYYDWARGCRMAANHQIFEVIFSAEDFVILCIKNGTKLKDSVLYQASPWRGIKVGDILPEHLRIG